MKKLRKISTIFIALVTLFAMTISVCAATDTSGTSQYAEFKYNRITVEAEDCIVSGTAVYKKVEYTDASNTVASGGYVAQPDSYTKAASPSVEDNSAITYTFYAPEAGNYVIWLRVVELANANGVYGSKQICYALDTAENYTRTSRFATGENENLTWVKLTTVNATQAGEHTIKLFPYGPLLYVDKILISNDIGLIPTGDGEARVSVGDKYYSTLQEAIGAATKDDTIMLLDNMETESINTETNFTLNLNGYTLKVSSFGKYVNVVDNSEAKTGLLEVAADACTLPPTNEQMPVYDGTKNGYVFVTIKDQNDGGAKSENSFKLIFRPSFGIDGTAKNTLLASGGEATGIRIKIRLDWKVDGAPKSQVLEYSNAMVATVYNPTDKKAFYINATGTDSFAGLEVTPYIESTTGVVRELTTFTINQ